MCTASRVWVTRTLLRSGWQWGGCECHGQDRRLQGVVWDRFGMKRLVTRVECVCRVRRAWDSIIVDPDISQLA